ncbi:hypothetical protein HOU03_gp407 [Caulobacter phage CcrSC]|uniref:Uncharacterized protein n=1 Tax=Caulobacter phage CcrSC TaxID=2283272 RepID=A0A385EDB8_9CAUD|nr:hypothetical protein HOU03_gp407 [Caulobacter phage CcrSC]AXQ69861.1 hypothetical protein CcrSC_gp279c [Caulobacter phage CcrSC]
MSRRKHRLVGYSIFTVAGASLMISGMVGGSLALALAGAFAFAPWAILLVMEAYGL